MNYKLLAEGLVLGLDLISRLAHSGGDDALDKIKDLTQKLVGDSTVPIGKLDAKKIWDEVTRHVTRVAQDDAEIDRKIAEKFGKKDS